MSQYLFGVFQYSFFDSIWAFYHFLSGIILGYFLLHKYSKLNYYALGIGLLVAWEVMEEQIRKLKSFEEFQAFLDFINQGTIFGKESAINVFSDIVLGTLGLYLIYKLISLKDKRVAE